MAQHIANLEYRILQYQDTIDDTVSDTISDTVKLNDTTSRLIAVIKEHPEYTYDEYAQILGIGRATVARHIKKLNGMVIHRIGQRRLLGVDKRLSYDGIQLCHKGHAKNAIRIISQSSG